MKTKNVVIGIAAVCIVGAGAFAINSSRHHASTATATQVQNDTNSDMNTTSDDTNSTDANSADTANTATGNSTDVSTSSVNSSDDAISVVATIYAAQKAKDSSLQIAFDHQETLDGQTAYVIHVFDNQNNHMATIGWVAVGSDGKVENYTLRNGWVDASKYQP